ncbi:hypothetical protein CHRYSEOSP005_14750 [Chryseobacterium sp. Alg-005]|uniref:hypothetical protein n=1 Tax=Chryseobacterium sp. Alg-005 TaxID=3159516 RepID=UPI003555782B
MNTLRKNQRVYFIGENLPYEVKAASNRYAIVTRDFDKKEDDDLLAFEVKRGASPSKKEAYNRLKDNPVYSIIDFQENWKAPNNLIFNHYDYSKQKDIDECLKDLESGEVELSKRHGCVLNIDWTKTTIIAKGDKIWIKDNLMEELVKHGFNEKEMSGFVNKFKGTEQTAFDVYKDEDNGTESHWVSVDIGCEIPLTACEKR